MELETDPAEPVSLRGINRGLVGEYQVGDRVGGADGKKGEAVGIGVERRARRFDTF